MTGSIIFKFWLEHLPLAPTVIWQISRAFGVYHRPKGDEGGIFGSTVLAGHSDSGCAPEWATAKRLENGGGAGWFLSWFLRLSFGCYSFWIFLEAWPSCTCRWGGQAGASLQDLVSWICWIYIFQPQKDSKTTNSQIHGGVISLVLFYFSFFFFFSPAFWMFFLGGFPCRSVLTGRPGLWPSFRECVLDRVKWLRVIPTV